jgi:hypothetical protein
MRGCVAVSDVHTNLIVACRIRPAGTELYRMATGFDAESVSQVDPRTKRHGERTRWL